LAHGEATAGETTPATKIGKCYLSHTERRFVMHILARMEAWSVATSEAVSKPALIVRVLMQPMMFETFEYWNVDKARFRV
jgi:hypothetical protein